MISQFFAVSNGIAITDPQPTAKQAETKAREVDRRKQAKGRRSVYRWFLIEQKGCQFRVLFTCHQGALRQTRSAWGDNLHDLIPGGMVLHG